VQPLLASSHRPSRLLIEEETNATFVPVNFTDGVVLSCVGASPVTIRLPFCYMVKWQAARAYPAKGFSVYDTALPPLALAQQDDYARYLHDMYLEGQGAQDRACRSSIKRLACAQAFPE
jgi:hypothetical protein